MLGIPPACQRGITHQNDRSNGQTVIPQPVSHDQRKSMQKQQHTQAGVFTRQLLQHTGGNMEKETAAKKIAYQNKDITSKVLAERFQGKTFCVYGLDLPVIIQAGPTNIPVVTARELRLDNLFELVDQSVAIVDYESSYKKEDKLKYLNYLTGIANRYRNEKKECPVLRIDRKSVV